MATMNFSVPEDVKQAFNQAFEGHNKSAVLTQLMREAILRIQEQQRREIAGQRILRRLPTAPTRAVHELSASRVRDRP